MKRLTAQEYLACERAADFKSEFYQGEVFAMSGGSPQHSSIAANFISEAGNGLKGKPCTKSTMYRDLPSLQELFLIAQDRFHVEHYVRQESGGWLLMDHRDLSESIELQRVGITIAVGEPYRDVEFKPEQANLQAIDDQESSP